MQPSNIPAGPYQAHVTRLSVHTAHCSENTEQRGAITPINYSNRIHSGISSFELGDAWKNTNSDLGIPSNLSKK